MRDGAKAMKISGSVLVFGKTKVECESNARALMGSWREKWFTLMLDKYVQLPVFTQCLPMNANNGMSRFLFRTKTVTTDQAFTTGRLIAHKEGILVGITSGAALYLSLIHI